MECEKFYDQIIEYSGNELDENGKKSVEEHLEGCADCRRYLSEIREIQDAIATEHPDPGQAYFESLTNRIMTQVREAPKTGVFARAAAWLTASLWRPAAALAPVAVAIVLAIYLIPSLTLENDAPSEDEISVIASLAEHYAPDRVLGLTPVSLTDEGSENTSDAYDSMASDISASLDDDAGVGDLLSETNSVSTINTVVDKYSGSYSDLSDDEMNQLHDHLAKAMDSWAI